MKKKIETDLQIVLNKINHHHKIIPGGAEIRCRSNIENFIQEAQKVVNSLNLKLKIVRTGEMSARNAFEILEAKDES